MQPLLSSHIPGILQVSPEVSIALVWTRSMAISGCIRKSVYSVVISRMFQSLNIGVTLPELNNDSPFPSLMTEDK